MPSFVEQASDIDAARAAARRIDIGDRLGRQQRLLEGIDRADVGLRRAGLDHDADADAREVLPRCRRRTCPCRRDRRPRGREHGEVEELAAFDALGERADRVVLDDDLVAGLLLEIRHEREQRLLEGARGEHLDLGRARAARRAGGHQHHRKRQQGHSHGVLLGCAHLTAGRQDSSNHASVRSRARPLSPPSLPNLWCQVHTR